MHRCALQAAFSLILMSVSTAALADTISQTFTVAGSTDISPLMDSLYPVASTPFSSFNATSGTLNSVTISYTGTAVDAGAPGRTNAYYGVTPSNNQFGFLAGVTSQVVSSPGDEFSFTESTSVSAPGTLFYFEGTGSLRLLLQFLNPATDLSVQNGVITYNYVPAITTATTPEPTTFVLLGTGLLGLAGTLKRRLA